MDTQIAKLKPKTANNKMAAIFAKLWREMGIKIVIAGISIMCVTALADFIG